MDRIGLGIFFGVIAGLFVGYLIGSWQATSAAVSSDLNSGRFLAQPQTEWLDSGRDMKLLNDFVFIDSRGRSWVAEKDCVVNGASIPQVFWSVIGGPFEGKYRNASIVHDAECEKMTSPSADVHRMFYDACRAGGVTEKEAKYLYWAVANYGPRWEVAVTTMAAAVEGPIGASLTDTAPQLVTIRQDEKTPSAEELKWAKKYFLKENPPIDQVPFLAPPGQSSESDQPLPPL